ncbi:helix-turn-helix domain-containing protein [Nocardiopsis dassonvillei subsp. albirubida]|uniref:Helix-turn-helix domain-containing protein n=1 Tax=Nocardiopsis alborubida TaxID=146802 RepID=A0A7X6MBK2_9ACTN|nr:helix-turn-helix domain-containing protein [Nocardiopsis alborubida]
MGTASCANCGRPHQASVSACACIPVWFWAEPDVTHAVERGEAAEVIRLLRRRVRGLTQEHIGTMCDLSQSTISRVESGRDLEGTRAQRVLEGLGAPTVDVTGEDAAHPVPVPPATGTDVVADTRLAALRRTVHTYDLPEDGPIRPLGQLRRYVAAVVQDRLNSRYERLLDLLPTLLPELTRALHTHHGTQRAHAARLLVQTYRAADAIADKRGLHDLSAHLIHIMRWAAAQTDDETVQAMVAYVRAETFFTTHSFELGRRHLDTTADRLTLASPHAQATYGALHMRAAVLAARGGDLDQGRDHLAEARQAAASTAEGVYAGTAFGPASVRIHEVTLAVDSGEPVDALAAAAGWTPPLTLPAERRSHFYVDLARAQAGTGRPELALSALESAWQTAPEHTRVHPQVYGLLTDLVRGPSRQRSAATAFAITAGIPLPT